MAKKVRLLAALALVFGTFPTHLAIANSESPSSDLDDSLITTLSGSTTDGTSTDLPDSPEPTSDPPDSDTSSSSTDASGSSVSDSGSNTSDASSSSVIPPLYIKAVSPGYTVSSKGNTGEFIELVNRTDSLISLENLSLIYNNGKNDYTIFDFPENSFLAPGSLVLRLQSSPEVKNVIADSEDSSYSSVANLIYAKDLASSGSLRLVSKASDSNPVSDSDSTSDSVLTSRDTSGNLILDSICWLGGDDCAKAFSSSAPSILVRDSETGELAHFSIKSSETGAIDYSLYPLNFSPENYQIIEPVVEDSEYEDEDPDSLDGSGDSEDDSLFPDVGTVSDDSSESSSELAACPEGKYRNPLTNRCKTIETEPEPKTCDEGYYLNEETNRCNKIKETTEKTCDEGYYLNVTTNRCNKIQTETALIPCKDGYERNPETNRCRKITTEEENELSPCAEGYERNPETNRCRKIQANNGADYALVPVTGGTEQKSFIAIWALVAVAALGLAVILFQFRHELSHFFKSLLAKMKK